MSEDPWKDLTPPESTAAFHARRVNAEAEWNFFWARDIDRRCLLVLSHATGAQPGEKLPTLKGIEVALAPGESPGESMLILKLLDSTHRDIFYHLCMDIMQGAEAASSEPEALKVTLARTWRWHHLLRGGPRGYLPEELQKGLIGELVTLELLISKIGGSDAVTAWLGPQGSPKDFEIGRVSIESKARRGGAKPFISISSEFQLDDDGCDELFLYVVELDRAAADSSEGMTLTEFAERARERLRSAEPAAIEPYEANLTSAGFDWNHDYTPFKWIQGPSRCFRVHGQFPRIVAAGLPAGVTNLRYSLSLPQCEPFLVDEVAVAEALSGANDVN